MDAKLVGRHPWQSTKHPGSRGLIRACRLLLFLINPERVEIKNRIAGPRRACGGAGFLSVNHDRGHPGRYKIAQEMLAGEHTGSTPAQPGEVTRLLLQMRRGEQTAESQLIELIYHELHKLASKYMRLERSDHSLQPTALVNEVYLRLSGGDILAIENRAHLLAIAGRTMRRILVDHARSVRTEKRGGLQKKVDIEEAFLSVGANFDQWIALDEALRRLEEWDPRQSRVVELRFFGGLSEEETAEVMEISLRTVKRDWKMAKAWLYAEITRGSGSDA